MHGTILTAALILLVALALPTMATAQTSAAPLRQPAPTGLLDGDEAAEVARAMDEAERRIGRTIHVDVVVDETGRRVSTGWNSYVPHDGAGYARETPMLVLAEDVNAPDGIVVLVDPFEGTGSFVEAPGLSYREDRYLSDLMTSEFRRGSYDAGLIAVARGLEVRFAPPRPLPPDPSRRGSGRGRGVSVTSVALFVGGTVAVISLLGHFLRGERFRGPDGREKGVGFVAARRDAEAALSALAPKVMLFAEREMAVLARLRGLGEAMPNCQSRSRAEGLLRRGVSGGFWKSFVAATALLEEDPEGALPELRRLSTEVETALVKLDEAERALRDTRSDDDFGGGDESLTREDENDG
jgi:hypothetical protein